MTLKSKTLSNCPFKSLNDGASDFWTASGTEYEYSQAGVTIKPLNVQESGTNLTEGTFGSLAVSEWAWDNSSGKLHIRTSGDVDPDSLSADVIKCSEPLEIFQAESALETIIIGMIIANNEDDPNDANVAIMITESDDVASFIMMFDAKATDSPITFQEKIVLNPEQKIKILSSRELVSVLISENEA